MTLPRKRSTKKAQQSIMRLCLAARLARFAKRALPVLMPVNAPRVPAKARKRRRKADTAFATFTSPTGLVAACRDYTRQPMKYVQNDGGREAAKFKGNTSDCVTRAIAIATGLPYRMVYDDLNARTIRHRVAGFRAGARTGVPNTVTREYLTALGWKWIPTMQIGSGCKVHLRASELPSGKIICSVSKHLCAVIDGVLHDAYDCSRNGTRCVYGYYVKA